MSLKEETQQKKFGGADLKSKIEIIWFSIVGQSKKEKKKKEKKSDGVLCFNAYLLSSLY